MINWTLLYGGDKSDYDKVLPISLETKAWMQPGFSYPGIESCFRFGGYHQSIGYAVILALEEFIRGLNDEIRIQG
jgi:hypothetical protein